MPVDSLGVYCDEVLHKASGEDQRAVFKFGRKVRREEWQAFGAGLDFPFDRRALADAARRLSESTSRRKKICIECLLSLWGTDRPNERCLPPLWREARDKLATDSLRTSV